MVPWADRRASRWARPWRSGLATDVTAGGVNEIMREALRVMPGLAGATLGEVRVGRRPASIDDSPLLGPLPGVPNVVSRPDTAPTGCSSARSPAASSPTSSWALPPLDPTPFSPARF